MNQQLETLKVAAMNALRRFPGDDNEDKERRALCAAAHIGDLMSHGHFLNLTEARLHLEKLFNISERNIRRAEKLFDFPEIVKLLEQNSISITNAAHVIEHRGLPMLRIAWECASEKDRQAFLRMVI